MVLCNSAFAFYILTGITLYREKIILKKQPHATFSLTQEKKMNEWRYKHLQYDKVQAGNTPADLKAKPTSYENLNFLCVQSSPLSCILGRLSEPSMCHFPGTVLSLGCPVTTLRSWGHQPCACQAGWAYLTLALHGKGALGAATPLKVSQSWLWGWELWELPVNYPQHICTLLSPSQPLRGARVLLSHRPLRKWGWVTFPSAGCSRRMRFCQARAGQAQPRALADIAEKSVSLQTSRVYPCFWVPVIALT